jgi:N-acetylmuramoyl-L-alanine amidase
MTSRHNFVKQFLTAAASAVALWVAAGCGGQGLLVREPYKPIFGSRVAVGSVQAPPAPVRQASWNIPADWRPSGQERPWRFIVVHHSATTWGSADAFDRIHRARGWDELGYHFVIGNGSGAGDGEVQIGPRWFKQKHGAHCKVSNHPEYNDVGIGICLVGNFNDSRPTEAQMRSLASLVRFLMDRYHIPQSQVFGHGQLKATDCPGRYFDYVDLWRRL